MVFELGKIILNKEWFINDNLKNTTYLLISLKNTKSRINYLKKKKKKKEKEQCRIRMIKCRTNKYLN